jgi:hypothetical protein
MATIALILLLTLAAYASTISTVNAATKQIQTYAYIAASPNPAGVGKTVVVTFRIDKLSPTATGTSGGDHFSTYTATITRPDGTIETKGPFTADSTSSGYFTYTPSTVGNYAMKIHFVANKLLGSVSLVGLLTTPTCLVIALQ